MFFHSFFNDPFICVNKIETKLTFIPPTQKYTLIPMFPKYLASQKKIWKQERE